MKIDLLIHGAAQLVTCASPGGPKRAGAMADVGTVEYGAVAVSDGKIVAVGPTGELCARYTGRATLDASDSVVCRSR